MSYRYATVVRQTMDDPRNDAEAGRVILVAGKHEDGYEYTVIDEDNERFLDIECETIEVVGPSEYRMGPKQIKEWAAEQDEAKAAAEL